MCVCPVSCCARTQNSWAPTVAETSCLKRWWRMEAGGGGGFGEPAVHGRGGIRQEAGLAVPALEKGAGDQLGQPFRIRGRGSDHRYAKTVRPEDPELGIVENNSTANSMSGQGTVCYNPQDVRQGVVGGNVRMHAHVMKVGERVGVDARAQGGQGCAQGHALRKRGQSVQEVHRRCT